MKHDPGIPGFALGLRPLTVENAECIVELRSDPAANRSSAITS